MITKHAFLVPIVALALFIPSLANAQEMDNTINSADPSLHETLQAPEFPADEFYRGRVTEILEEGTQEVGGLSQPFQRLKIEITSGKEKGTTQEILYGRDVTIVEDQKFAVGDGVVLVKIYSIDGPSYFLMDGYRVPALFTALAIFIFLVIIMARLKGVASLLGLLFTVLVLMFYIIPRIMSGANPLTVSLTGAFIIAVVSLYLAHGFSRRTSIALGSTVVSLGLSALLAVAFVSMGRLFGLGSEEAFFVQVTPTATINLRGLLLGGIIIGALGVLDDITTAQTAAVDEIHKANPTLSTKELYRRGLSVGKEHISSLVNTLVLAYAGASLPLFLLFSLNEQPWWVVLNSEHIAEEVIRTLVGSSTLVLAVPIATYFAARLLISKRKTT